MTERNPATQPQPPPAHSVLDRMLGSRAEGTTGSVVESTVTSWSETAGVLDDRGPARLGASCLLRPQAGDRVLMWQGAGGDRWILAVLERPETAAPAVLATAGPLSINAPQVALNAGKVHLQANDFVTGVRNRHTVEHVRTESVHTRVAQVGTDVRRANHVTDEVQGTVLQRAGTWISTTLREARLHARAFLFD